MKRPPLSVTLHARESSVVEMTVGERVQLDRLSPSPHGYLAARHGSLLDPGVTGWRFRLATTFSRPCRTLTCASWPEGVAAGTARGIKTTGPDLGQGGSGSPEPNNAGDEAAGDPPRLTVE